MSARPLSAAILCGGQSSRFGSDKARFRAAPDREPVLLELAQKLKSLGFTPMILSGQSQKYTDLQLPGLSDIHPQIGPLGGIHAALHATDADAILFLTCDMPEIAEADLSHLQAAWNSTSAGTSLFFKDDDIIYPFPAIYSHTLLPLIEKQMAHKDFSIRSLIVKIERAKWLAPLQASHFANINTQRDLRQMYELARID